MPADPRDMFADYHEYKQYDDLMMEDYATDDVFVEQDNEYVADKWADAEDYEWM